MFTFSLHQCLSASLQGIICALLFIFQKNFVQTFYRFLATAQHPEVNIIFAVPSPSTEIYHVVKRFTCLPEQNHT